MYTTGLVQYFKNSTSVGGDLSASGIVTGGERTEETDILTVRTVGDWKPSQLREGMIKASGSVNLELQTAGLLLLANRIITPGITTYGRLPEFDIECGDYGTSVIHKNCKIDSITLDLAKGDSAKASVNWKGLYWSAGAIGQSHVVSTNPVLMWFDGAIAGGTLTGAEILSVSINVNHNTDWQPLIDNTLTPQRRAKYVIEKAQDVTFNLKLLANETTDLSALAIANIPLITVTLNSGTTSILVSLINCKPQQHSMPISPVELVEYGVNYTAKDFLIA